MRQGEIKAGSFGISAETLAPLTQELDMLGDLVERELTEMHSRANQILTLEAIPVVPGPATSIEGEQQPAPQDLFLRLRNGRSFARVPQNQRNTRMTRNQVPLYTGPPSSSARVRKRPAAKIS